MRIVAARLQPLDVPFAFIGGAVMCLLVDHPELTEFRRTKDVDVIVAVVTYTEFAALEERLRGQVLSTIPLKAPRYAVGWWRVVEWTSCRKPRQIWE
jgi:hypothetical protein